MTTNPPVLLSHLNPAAADRRADGSAVTDTTEELDRAELCDRVARTAGAMRDAGVDAGDRVVVCAAKSVASFVAVHAAQHAGAIAVPIDPASTEHAVAAVVDDVTPTLAVVDPQTAPRFAGRVDVTLGAVPPDDRSGRHLAWADVGRHDPIPPIDRRPEDLAYLITTSGSTGRPKCIAHSHESGLAYAELAATAYDLDENDRMANVAPFHFDQSTFELYAAPLVGASVVLVSDVLLRFPASMSELLERERVTTWYSVPTILRHLLDRGALDRRDLTALRWVLFGGEVFPAAPLRRLMAAIPTARFSNVYGPAEVNQCTVHHLTGPPDEGTDVPIGRATPSAHLMLVDEADDPIEGAGTGQLLVSAPTAMSGYWGRPDLDLDAFVERPDAEGTNRRWYRTGDVCGRDAEGVLVFHGRVDRQVKRRGVRIELESIEQALGQLPGVTGCAAIVTDEEEPRIVAMLESTSVDAVDAVGHARTHLSPSTRPDDVVVARNLPRTTSGKIDAVAAARLHTEGLAS